MFNIFNWFLTSAKQNISEKIVKNLKEEPESEVIDTNAVFKLFGSDGFVPRNHMLHPITKAILYDGEPCGHPGCLAHKTHPCEVCGRKGGITECSD